MSKTNQNIYVFREDLRKRLLKHIDVDLSKHIRKRYPKDGAWAQLCKESEEYFIDKFLGFMGTDIDDFIQRELTNFKKFEKKQIEKEVENLIEATNTICSLTNIKLHYYDEY